MNQTGPCLKSIIVSDVIVILETKAKNTCKHTKIPSLKVAW